MSVAGVYETTPLVMVFCVRCVPLSLRMGTLVELGTNATGLIPRFNREHPVAADIGAAERRQFSAMAGQYDSWRETLHAP